jgi:hypothetical protein
VNALASDEVGKYLNANFVSSFQKVATFRIAGKAKQGGNVASYFCDPDGRVLHAVAGPANATTFLREARWAVEAQKLALLESGGDDIRLRAAFHQAHAERLRQEHGLDLGSPAVGGQALARAGQVHLLLAAAPLVKIERAYKLVFERILGEKVSFAPVVEAKP